jgi:hypothetical protein
MNAALRVIALGHVAHDRAYELYWVAYLITLVRER